MQLDFEDILAGTFGRILAIFLFAISAAWAGSVVAALSLEIGSWVFAFTPADLLELGALLQSPRLLLTAWIIPNFGVLALLLTYLFVSENFGMLLWGGLMIVEAAFAMMGEDWEYLSTNRVIACWMTWLVLVAMTGTGVWLIRQMAVSRWVRQLAMLKAENAIRRAERAALAAASDGDALVADEGRLK